jgi:hypothetical protein
MKKMIAYIIVGVVILLVLGGVFLVLKYKIMKNEENTGSGNMQYVTGVALFNPLDKRVLTKQGEAVLIEAIDKGDYSTEVVNTTDYEGRDGWKSYIEKGIYLEAHYPDYRLPDTYIIPTGMAHWKEGRAYKLVSAGGINSDGKQVDKIEFNNFKLSDFLNEDPNFIKELAPARRPVSLMLQLSGQDVDFELRINDRLVIYPPVRNGGVIPLVIGGEGSFNFGININDYLTAEIPNIPSDKILSPDQQGINVIRIKVKNVMSDKAGLHVTVTDAKKQGSVIIDQEINQNNLVEGGGQDFNLQIEPGWDLIKQESN